MGEIETKIKDAVNAFKKDGNIAKLVMSVAATVNYSVRYKWMWLTARDAIKEHCPGKPTFECVYYDGENGGIYHLLDFDPNEYLHNRDDLIAEITSKLEHQVFVELDYLDKAMESVYLINTGTLIRVSNLEKMT